MDIKRSTSDIWRIIDKVDWTDQSFSSDKAYLCVLLSKLTYNEIPDYELKGRKRINVIPSYDYRELIKKGSSSKVTTILQNSDFGNVFTIFRKYAVIIGVRTKKVTFIAIRGTKYLYDWKINLNLFKQKLNVFSKVVEFHKGFYRAISECFQDIITNVSDDIKNNIPIYITGHSLGGALSSILNCLWDLLIYSRYRYYYLWNTQRAPSCYTFGMPRYGDRNAVSLFSNPIHIYNSDDIIPQIPSRFMGYENSSIEFLLNDNLTKTNIRENHTLRNLIRVFPLMYGIKYHSIDHYEVLLNNIVKINGN